MENATTRTAGATGDAVEVKVAENGGAVGNGKAANPAPAAATAAAAATTPASDDNSETRRKFRILGLRHPSWVKDAKLTELIDRADHAHVWFERVAGDEKNQKEKTGGMSLTFATTHQAHVAFSEAQAIVIDGVTVKVQASKAFYDPPQRRASVVFPAMEDADKRARTLYALNLTGTHDTTLMKSIFGEDMEECRFLSQGEKNSQAEVVMSSPSTAASAKEDVDYFELSDGDQQVSIRVLTPDEYTEWSTTAAMPWLTRQPTPLSTTSTTATMTPSLSTPHDDSARTPSMTSPPPSARVAVKKDDEVSSSMASSRSQPSSHAHDTQRKQAGWDKPTPSNLPPLADAVATLQTIIHEEKMNWAEVTTKEELYELADRVSLMFGALPDDFLKRMMLSTMEGALRETSTEGGWMRKHLEEMIKMWKREMLSTVLFDRPSRVLLQSGVISALPPPDKRRKRTRNQKEMRAQMGLGSVLESARMKFGTEEGELDMEDDEDGNILIGGERLSFDMWAKFNRAPLKSMVMEEVESAGGRETKTSTPDRITAGEVKLENRRKKRAEKQQKKEAIQKAKVVEKSELEEGEMQSEEEETSDSSDEEIRGSRRRRMMNRTRNQEATQGSRGDEPRLPPLFQSIYDNRYQIISQLSKDRQAAFCETLSQILMQNVSISGNKQREMLNYMSQTFG